MSQIIIDDQLRPSLVLAPIRRWITAQRLKDLRPTEVIKDERVPDFKTKKSRMGKVAKVGFTNVEYWQLGDDLLHCVYEVNQSSHWLGNDFSNRETLCR